MLEAIRQRAAARPGRTAFTFVDYPGDGEPRGETRELTYEELEARIRTVGERLRRTTAPGARAAILCPTGADYVVGFLACLYAGVVAVPLFAPEPHRPGDRVALAMDNCACEVALTPRAAREAVAQIPLSAPVRILCPDEIAPDPDVPWNPAPAEPGATAYLQYTSGSTRHPAGVRVTHHNMATAAEQLATHLSCDARSTIVSWIPFFHDMGLVFAVLLPLARGFPAVHMAPFAFVREPVRWLRLLGEHAGTHVLVPNFALDMCVDRIPKEDRAGLHLDRLVFFGNGSEPVRPASLARFTEAFAPYGFRPSAHGPAYGLAEATLMVTGVRVDEEPLIRAFDRAELNAGRVRAADEGNIQGLTLAGCGTPLDQEVRIVDPQTARPAAADRVGEVWIRGDNVCAGYWDEHGAEHPSDTFGAVLDGEGGWLRTGDLGFVHGGALFIAGRRKDLIVIDGRNHHPIDIELTVQEAVPGVRPGHVVAFPIDTGEREQVVVAAEMRQSGTADLGELRTVVRRTVAARHDLHVHDVVFLRRGTLPKTSSGKLQRRACRDRYQRGALRADRDGAPPPGASA